MSLRLQFRLPIIVTAGAGSAAVAVLIAGCGREPAAPVAVAPKSSPSASPSGGHDAAPGHAHKAPAGTFVASAGDFHFYLEPMASGCLTLRVLDADEKPLPIEADRLEVVAKVGDGFKTFALPAQSADAAGRADRFYLHTDWIRAGVRFDLRAKVPVAGRTWDAVFENVTPGGSGGHAGHDMDPVKAAKAGGNYDVVLSGTEGLVAGREATIGFQILDRRTGRPAAPLDTVHERIVHVLLVSADLETFRHVHPEDFGTVTETDRLAARFSIRATFPAAGSYQMLFDFTHSGEMAFKPVTVTVAPQPGAPMQKAAPQPDFAAERRAGDYVVTLRTDGTVTAGKEAELVFDIRTVDGRPVTDLGMYLGAEMHLAGWRSDLSGFLHQHPYVPGGHHHHGEGHAHPQTYRGPTIPVRHTFAEPGDYRLFAQFLHNGAVRTADFWVRVN
jgi:hypothetical protein